MGTPFKVVKYATDITRNRLQQADYRGQIAAINKSQAVIEFDPKGHILDANTNFQAAMGYSLEEIVGKHHSTFVDPEERTSPEYLEFWEKLSRGELQSGQYRRWAKGGREVWLQASYNSIKDDAGNTIKVVKYATDITEQKQLALEISLLLPEATRVISALAQGDLTGTMTGEYSDRFDGLKTAIDGSMQRLNSMLSRLSNTATALDSSSNQLSTVSAELRQGATDTANQTNVASSAANEISQSVDGVASAVSESQRPQRDQPRLLSACQRFPRQRMSTSTA